jgi:hypothetical protein
MILFIGGKRSRASFLFLQDWLKNFWWYKPLWRHLKASSVLHPESSPIADRNWIQQQLECFFFSQNWACYEEQFDFKQAVEDAEK